MDPSILPCTTDAVGCQEIEAQLIEMTVHDIIAPQIELVLCKSSLTYSQKANGCLYICLDPRELNGGNYSRTPETPTLEEINHQLEVSSVYSKFVVKNGFLSIRLSYEGSLLINLNPCLGHL